MKETVPKLTKKQRGFVADYILDENGTQAALKNYDTKDYKTASVIAAENLDKPSIQVAIENARKTLKQALLDKGINEDYLADKVNTLLTAVDKEGNTDYTAIDKGLKHATNIFGIEDESPKEKIGNIYNLFFSSEVQNEVKQMEDKIKEALIKKRNAK